MVLGFVFQEVKGWAFYPLCLTLTLETRYKQAFLDLVKTLYRYFKYTAYYCLLSRKIEFFFLLFNILNFCINPFPDALCCRNIYLFSSEIYERNVHKMAF